MRRYVARRILQAIAVIYGVVTVTFIVLRVIPSDPARALLPSGRQHPRLRGSSTS